VRREAKLPRRLGGVLVVMTYLKELLTLRPRIQEFEYLDQAGVTMTGQIARSSGNGSRPGVLVMHSALGLDDLVRSRAQDLAALGYVALATDMYGVGPEPMSKEECGPLFLALQQDPDLLRSRAVSGLDALRALPEVDATRVSAIGYCFGGQCALELARTGARLSSVVSFHGMLTTAKPAQPGAVCAKLLTISGAMDPYVPAKEVAAFQEEMTAAGADWQVTVYGGGLHAFTMPDIEREGVPGTAYDPFLDRLSWAQATAFLAATLS
jgi:dienelactone hydrolase